MGDHPVTFFRITAVLLLTLTFVFLEAAFQWPHRLLGAQIDLLPALMVFTALRLGLGTIVTVAFLGGLSMDALSLNPLGASPLPLCMIGVLLHWKRDQIHREELIAHVLLGGGASLVAPLGTLVMILTAGSTPLLGIGFAWDLLVMTVGGAIATPFLFQLMNLLEGALIYQPHSQPSFRPDREIRRGRH